MLIRNPLVVLLLATLTSGSRHANTIPDGELLALKETLEKDGDGTVLFPGDGVDYTDLVTPYSPTCVERPKAVFLPSSEDGLRASLKLATSHDVELVVSTTLLNQDCISTTDAYLLNMRKFQTMEFVEEDRKAIRLGAGLMSDEANVFVKGFGDYFVNSIMCTWGGVVGPIFGGGFFWQHAYRTGSMAENVLSVQFMDYNGNVYETNKENEPDLFWALRGGAGQLGIVMAVTMRVWEQNEQKLRFATYAIPWANGGDKTAESVVETIDQIGKWYNSLPGNVGCLAVFPHLIIACDDCDIEDLVTSRWPDAVAWEGDVLSAEDGGTYDEIYANSRELTRILGFWDAGRGNFLDPTAPITWQRVNELNPMSHIKLGAYFFKEYHEGIKETWKELIHVQPEILETAAMWSAYYGDGITHSGDSAASSHNGATVSMHMGYLGNNGFEPLRHFTKLMSRPVANAMSEYWNYKNEYTSEENSLTFNYDQIMAIRKKYDPEGFFTLPARKNSGSSKRVSCFAPYDCNGNGKIDPKSSGKISDGCQCICKKGFGGAMCKVIQKNFGAKGKKKTRKRRGRRAKGAKGKARKRRSRRRRRRKR